MEGGIVSPPGHRRGMERSAAAQRRVDGPGQLIRPRLRMAGWHLGPRGRSGASELGLAERFPKEGRRRARVVHQNEIPFRSRPGHVGEAALLLEL